MNLQTLEKPELIQLIDTLWRENEELRRVNKNNKSWLALLAHDFKSIFSSIIWTATLYKNKTISLEILAGLLPELEVNAYKNLRALDDTFLAAKIQFENSLIQQESINLFEVYTEIKESVSDALHEKEITISFLGSEEASVTDSKLLVKSVLTKIIDNAIKFSYRGGEILFTIEKAESGTTQITIEDFGVGIDDYTFGKLFSFDAGPTLGTEEERGAGLGLVLVKEALNSINGTIDISTTKDKGTQVKISL